MNAIPSILLAVALSSWGQTEVAATEDVARFIEQREACDHFRGEEAYDAERKKYLRLRTRQLCTGTDAMLRALRLKYRAQPDVLGKLERFEDSIE